MAALLASLAVALVASGAGSCTDDVPPRVVDVTPPPTAGAATQRFCSALDEALPGSLGELDRRRTSSAAVAAWGDPPVVLRCGVPPVQRPPGDTRRVELAGVGWYPEEVDGAVRWTTLDLPVAVEVLVPDGYEGQVLIGLSPALRAAPS